LISINPRSGPGWRKPVGVPGALGRREARLFAGAVTLQTVAVAVDLSIPAGYGLALIYVAVMMTALWITDRRLIIALAVLGTLFLVAGYLFSPPTPLPRLSVLVGRTLAAATIWLVAFLALSYQRSRAELLQSESVLLHAQRVAEAGQARLRSILETAPEAIITIDDRGIVDSFSASAEKLFGYEASEVVGRNVSMLMPAPYREEHDNYISRYLQTGERRIIGIGRLVQAQRKDGTTFPMELAVGEVVSGGERTFTGFIRDISSRQRMEQELRQSQRMEAVGQLTGGIAHDFNNLLTVILGNLEMLEPRIQHDAKAAGWLREAYETAQLGAELTGRLLAFARRQPLNPQVVDLGARLAQATNLLKRTLGESIELRTVIGAPEARAEVDPGLLENAILNLCINARDAMPEGGMLTLDLSAVTVDADYAHGHAELHPGRYALVSVSDTGVGMSPEVRDRAFEPFFTTKPVGAGTGLGLSMVYGFAKQSGGHVQIQSAPGQGTTVQLFLPLVAEASSEIDLEGEAALDAYAARGETVLVVEDDARVRRVTVARLEGLGYRVIEAESGPQALDVLAEQGEGVGLLFTDMVMPGGMSGGDLVRTARLRMPSIRVLFTSGFAQPEMVSRGLAESGNWLRKPYTAVDLARKLREVFDQPA